MLIVVVATTGARLAQSRLHPASNAATTPISTLSWHTVSVLSGNCTNSNYDKS